MNKTKFTPGPWERDGLKIRVHGRGVICAVVARPQDGGTFDCQENASLIAAAPEMYEALKEVLESFAAPDAALEKVQRALARAEGRT